MAQTVETFGCPKCGHEIHYNAWAEGQAMFCPRCFESINLPEKKRSIQCPKCEQEFEYAERFGGMETPCPTAGCGGTLLLPKWLEMTCPNPNCLGRIGYPETLDGVSIVGETTRCPGCNTEVILGGDEHRLPKAETIAEVPAPAGYHSNTVTLFDWQCPSCGCTGQYHRHEGGKHATCPSCNREIYLPAVPVNQDSAQKQGSSSFRSRKGRLLVNTIKFCLLFLVIHYLFFGFEASIPVSGMVFVKTRGGDVIRMASIEVWAFNRDTLHDSLSEFGRKLASGEMHVQGDDEALGNRLLPLVQIQSLNKKRHFYRTTTDINGEFHFTFRKPGEYYFVATAQRDIGREVERYFWVVRSMDYSRWNKYWGLEISNADDKRTDYILSDDYYWGQFFRKHGLETP